jgi:hypothetical protein
MEVAWEDRGNIARTEFDKDVDGLSNIKCEPWDTVSKSVKHWWNRVFDACVNTEILHMPSDTPDGSMIKIVVTKEKDGKNGGMDSGR